ncbi:hypothetical protein Tco_0617805 [Tanacetum coccineum]
MLIFMEIFQLLILPYVEYQSVILIPCCFIRLHLSICSFVIIKSEIPTDDLTKDLLASLAISPFHDDPYMKVMQTYNATSNESPIPRQALIAPPTVLPPSLIGENYHGTPDTSYARHEEQIETILNHLDELPLERIEYIEDMIKGLGNGRDFYSRDDYRGYPGLPSSRYEESSGQVPMAPKRTSTFAAPAMSQAAIRKLVADSVAAALEAQAATMANADNTNRNTGQGEDLVARKLFLRSNYTEDRKVKFDTGTLTEEALS